MWWEVGRARAVKTLRGAGASCLFWVAGDAASHRLGWGTVLAAAITVVMVLLLQATLLWVEVLDRRERAANDMGGADGPALDGFDRTPPAASSGQQRGKGENTA